ncbi:hypothetical protein OV079_46240 [Nannocystis pusilla]|uniref:Uncharacterized protein n=1 Tax=Nannocystis pusilla TaxID=889268 RepID=A0A9X3EYW2_9BACT|nr:hypothetical protein [Nannocystis pusilla]MCY1012817.1 hypothetical protein [Nannocystis pusilla]
MKRGDVAGGRLWARQLEMWWARIAAEQSFARALAIAEVDADGRGALRGEALAGLGEAQMGRGAATSSWPTSRRPTARRSAARSTRPWPSSTSRRATSCASTCSTASASISSPRCSGSIGPRPRAGER